MKLRFDFSAHKSVIVEVPDGGEEMEEKAQKIAENCLLGRGVYANWELDDGGIEEVDDSFEADAIYGED